jgi:hypothetical protein
LAVLLTGAAVLIAGCGGSEMALAEYAEELESGVTAMNTRIDTLEPAFHSDSVDEVIEAWDRRLEARQTFLEKLRAMRPPSEAAEAHDAAIDVVARLIAAEQAFGERGAESETAADFWDWDSPEGEAALALDQEGIAFCQAAEAGLTDSADGGFAVEGWLSPEVRDIIEVLFGCVAEDRPTAP